MDRRVAALSVGNEVVDDEVVVIEITTRPHEPRTDAAVRARRFKTTKNDPPVGNVVDVAADVTIRPHVPRTIGAERDRRS